MSLPGGFCKLGRCSRFSLQLLYMREQRTQHCQPEVEVSRHADSSCGGRRCRHLTRGLGGGCAAAAIFSACLLTGLLLLLLLLLAANACLAGDGCFCR
jgi:hypothetical protein